jgi:hypothetical protein
VLVPLVLAIGVALGHRVPQRARPPISAALLITALLITAVLTAGAWPLIRGYGRNPGVPSYLSRIYATGLLAALALTWILAATWIVLGRRNRA